MKERIKSKADELFYKYGIKAVTMDEIAQQLGISKKTIYLYFSDKDQLVDAVFSDIIIKNQDNCCSLREKAKNAIHEGFLAIELMQEMFGDINPLILFDLQRNHPDTFSKFQQHKYKFLYQTLSENIQAGIDQGLFREDVNIEVAAKLRLESMFLPFSQDLFPKIKFNLAELQKQLIEFYLFSLVTPKGYKLIIKYKEQLNKKEQ